MNHLQKKSRLFSFRHLSIRQRLPLLMCVLLLSIILVFGCISYLGVRKASLKIGEDRLHALTEQLSTTLATSAQNLVLSNFIGSNKSAIKKYLLSRGKDSSTKALKILQGLQKDSTYL